MVRKYSDAWGFPWEVRALPLLGSFKPSTCKYVFIPSPVSDQLYPDVKTAQASLSNVIIFSYWKDLGFCDVKRKFSGPRTQRGTVFKEIRYS